MIKSLQILNSTITVYRETAFFCLDIWKSDSNRSKTIEHPPPFRLMTSHTICTIITMNTKSHNGSSLARLNLMNQVGGKADTCGGLSTDTAFLFGNGAEGVVAVEPEAVFHGCRSARRECLPGGTQ